MLASPAPEGQSHPVTLAAATSPPTAQPLAALQALVGADMARVNALILERMQNEVALIPQLAGHIVASGGKRLRPMLTLASARLCGYGGQRHIELAACVEFIHTATLLHDDVVDESRLRRGTETANAVWGNQASVLVGDFLFSRSFQLMVDVGSLEVLGILANASATIAEGEVRQLATVSRPETGIADYLKVIEGKTAALFAAACRIGAVIADRPREESEALDAYGMNLGMAFQLVDDVLDYSARQADLGKTVGDDFAEGKVTLPVILAFDRGNEEERAFWRRVLREGGGRPEDFHRAVALLRRHDALAETLEWARSRAGDAKRELRSFPDGPARTVLADIADFCVDRAY